MALALAPVDGEVVEGPRLEELARVANESHRAAVAGARTTLDHAIRAGHALALAKERVPRGQWQAWLRANFVTGHHTACRYIRVAAYADSLPQDATIEGWDGALRRLAGMPRVNSADEMRREAAHLRSKGLKLREIGELLGGVGAPTVHRWLHPRSRASEAAVRNRRLRRERLAREALRQRERDRAMQKVGGSAAECYSMVRRTAQAVDRAKGTAETPELRLSYGAALEDLYRAQDKITRAVGVS